MKNIYILQMYSDTIPSKLIRKSTKYEYSHIALSFDKDCDKIYSFGRKSVGNIFNGGFIAETKTGKFYTKFNKTVCRVFELETDDEKYDVLKDTVAKMEENSKKYKYDYLGIILRYFKIPVTFRNKYVCSYFVADLLEKAKIYKFNNFVPFTSPQDFENLEGAKEIYTGEYVNMHI